MIFFNLCSQIWLKATMTTTEERAVITKTLEPYQMGARSKTQYVDLESRQDS